MTIDYQSHPSKPAVRIRSIKDILFATSLSINAKTFIDIVNRFMNFPFTCVSTLTSSPYTAYSRHPWIIPAADVLISH